MTLDYGAAEGDAAAPVGPHARRPPHRPASSSSRTTTISPRCSARELRGLGHTVDAVRFAEEALIAARATDYALMIVDLGLPDGDGLDLVREMRRRVDRGAHPDADGAAARRGPGDRADQRRRRLSGEAVRRAGNARAGDGAAAPAVAAARAAAIAIANLVVDCDALEAVVDGVQPGAAAQAVPAARTAGAAQEPHDAQAHDRGGALRLRRRASRRIRSRRRSRSSGGRCAMPARASPSRPGAASATGWSASRRSRRALMRPPHAERRRPRASSIRMAASGRGCEADRERAG